MSVSGLDFITKSSFSAVSSHNVLGCFSSNYEHYLVKVKALGSVNLYVRMRFLSGSTPQTDTGYARRYILREPSGASVGGNTGATYMFEGYGLNSCNATPYYYAQAWISHPGTSGVRKTGIVESYVGITSTPNTFCEYQRYTGTSAYDGMQLSCNTGNITGSVSIWGVVKS